MQSLWMVPIATRGGEKHTQRSEFILNNNLIGHFINVYLLNGDAITIKFLFVMSYGITCI